MLMCQFGDPIQYRLFHLQPHPHHSTYFNYEPFQSGINIKSACQLEHLAPTTILDSPSLPTPPLYLMLLTPYSSYPLQPIPISTPPSLGQRSNPQKMVDIL